MNTEEKTFPSVEEQVEKNFIEVKKISQEKMLGQNGVMFYEPRFNQETNEIEQIEHVAYPVILKHRRKLNSCLKYIEQKEVEMQKEKMDVAMSLQRRSKEIDSIAEGNQTEENLVALNEITKMSAHIKQVERDFSEKVYDKLLDIAELCFSRSEVSSREDLESWMTEDQLQSLRYVAQGMTYPPKQSQGKGEMII